VTRKLSVFIAVFVPLHLELVKLNGDKVIDRQKIATDVGRNVQRSDGFIYMGVEGEGIVKIIPN
jgi:hypothetical protein